MGEGRRRIGDCCQERWEAGRKSEKVGGGGGVGGSSRCAKTIMQPKGNRMQWREGRTLSEVPKDAQEGKHT